MLRTYHLLARFAAGQRAVRRNEDAILAATNLVVFVFTMTGIVYATQHGHNPAIQTRSMPCNFLGHVAPRRRATATSPLRAPTGRLLSVFVMICGVTLFFRLAQVCFPPTKCASLHRVWVAAPRAGRCPLQACGNILNIPDEGHT